MGPLLRVLEGLEDWEAQEVLCLLSPRAFSQADRGAGGLSPRLRVIIKGVGLHGVTGTLSLGQALRLREMAGRMAEISLKVLSGLRPPERARRLRAFHRAVRELRP